MDGFVGAVVGGFEFAGRLVLGVGAVVEAAIGERAAQAFVEEQEEERDLNAFAGAVALQQPVAFDTGRVTTILGYPTERLIETE